jgi:hypothetical protein
MAFARLLVQLARRQQQQATKQNMGAYILFFHSVLKNLVLPRNAGFSMDADSLVGSRRFEADRRLFPWIAALSHAKA